MISSRSLCQVKWNNDILYIPIRDPNTKFSLLQKIRGGGKNMSLCTLHCINLIMYWLCNQYGWSGKVLLGTKEFWDTVKTKLITVKCILKLFFNRARFPLARLSCFTLWALLLYKINISFALGHRFLSEATQIQPRRRIIIRGYPEDTGI